MASQDARLSKFEADFKQQQGEMTNKINIVLKAITDRIMRALSSDMVKNPNMNVNSTSLVLFARSYLTEDPQCSACIHSSINATIIYPKQPSKPHDGKPGENKIAKTGTTDEDHHAMVRVESEHKKSEEEEREEEGNTENINTDSPSQPDPSISFIIEKGDKGDIMFTEIIKKYDDSREEELKEKENAATRGLEVEYFDTFLTRSERAYHNLAIAESTVREPRDHSDCRTSTKTNTRGKFYRLENGFQTQSSIGTKTNAWCEFRRLNDVFCRRS
nr:ribonuclease H-like domain-containing protein [Tanacetum cinerariifolium]